MQRTLQKMKIIQIEKQPNSALCLFFEYGFNICIIYEWEDILLIYYDQIAFTLERQ